MLSWRSSRGRRRLRIDFHVMPGTRQTPAFAGRTLAFNSFVARLSVELRRVLLKMYWDRTHPHL